MEIVMNWKKSLISLFTLTLLTALFIASAFGQTRAEGDASRGRQAQIVHAAEERNFWITQRFASHDDPIWQHSQGGHQRDRQSGNLDESAEQTWLPISPAT